MNKNITLSVVTPDTVPGEPLADIHDRVAEAYYGKMGAQFMRETQDRIHWICDQVQGTSVLDVGCSQGIVALLLAREGIKVTGIDTSPKAIEQASLYLASEPDHVQEKVEFINADFLSLDLQKLKFETIVMSEVLEHLVQPQRFLDIAAKILPKKGRLIITVPFGINDFIDHKHTFYLLEPLKLIAKHFDVVEIEVLGKWLGVVAQLRDGIKPKAANVNLTENMLKKLEAAFFQIERNLRDDVGAARKKFDDINQKYRAATEQEEASRLAAEQALEQIQTQMEQAQARRQEERAALQQEIGRLAEQAQANSIAAHDAEKKLIRLEAEHATATARLEAANQKYRAATRQEEASRLAAEQAQARRQEERAALQQEIGRLAEQAQANSIAAHDAEKKLIRLTAEHATVTVRLEAANQKYRAATEQVNSLKKRIAQEEASRQAAEQALGEIPIQLEQANLKYRWLIAEELPKLKEKLEVHASIAREQKHKIEQLALEDKKNKKALAEANNKLQQLHHQKIEAEQKVIKTRASLAFQLGYLLMHGFTSVRGFMGLGRAFWAWRNELITRQKRRARSRKALDHAASSPKVASPVVRLQEQSSSHTTPLANQIADQVLDRSPSTIVPVDVMSKKRPQLKIACIMDEFTFGSYRHECDTQQLTPDHWKAELSAFMPQLLFIESAWRGKDELWGSKVGHTSQELQDIVAWCRAMSVPTIFWNKEDPVHFESFLTTAKLFDYVFTTDIDCIHRYKAALGHDRVYLLPFACQPATNHPIETYERKDAFCFAGAYYTRYPERTRDLGNFAAELPTFRPLEIYDRNYGKNDPNYQFPAAYQPYIVGTLPFDQIDKAYKGYRYAINLNSIKQSQSMFARRVFELLASNTVTVSNFSRGIRILFGDLIITTDNGSEMVRKLNMLASDDEHARKLRLAALRKVMHEHTYEQRLSYVVSKALQKPMESGLPHIAVVAHAANQVELDAVLACYRRQHYANTTLHVVTGEGLVQDASVTGHRVRLIRREQIVGQTVRACLSDADLIAPMVPEDYYGPNYLLDIALATRYSDAVVIGKGSHHVLVDGTIQLKHGQVAYRPITRIPARCASIRMEGVANAVLIDWLDSLLYMHFESVHGLAIDEFNYCRHGADKEQQALVSRRVDDLPNLNTGISIDELLARAERIAPQANSHDEGSVITGKQLASYFTKAPSSAIQLTVDGNCWRVDSTLADGKHEYVYATIDHSPESLGFDNQLKIHLDTTPGLNIQLVILFLDAQKQKISHVIKHANRNQEAEIPTGTAKIRFGLRFYAGGNAEIKGLVLGHRDIEPAEMIGQGEHLLITNHYPSYDDLYRNGFVHSRVRAYRERDVKCDVFRLRSNEAVSYHEFEDVDVTTGSQEALHRMLCSGQYKSVLVHFLDLSMWEVLQRHIHRLKIIVWVHGAEIQPWWRRDYNYHTEEARAVGKLQSEQRMAFWRGLLKDIPANLKLVFVSRYFAEEVMEDLGFRIPEKHYAIIHNPIDTEIFSYQKKPVEQRKKVLSIRPYASAKYANDLSVKAIQLLSNKSWFYDMEFRMIGDGSLFEETLAPLRKFRNVYIEQRFLKQDEIAALHKEYGMFLCPTRMDAQGVSRDEAMASGLVPVTNAVTAIPEFVDESCGVLAAGEDAEAMAKGIAELYEEPEQFAALSIAAAARVRRQSDLLRIIGAEMRLMK